MPPRSKERSPLPLLLLVVLLLVVAPTLAAGFLFAGRLPSTSPGRRRTQCPSPLASSSDEYVLSGPANDEDERAFVLPSSLAAPVPLPEAVQTYGGFASPSKARKLIRRGQVVVNGKVCTCQDAAGAGDRVEVRPVEPRHKRRDGKPRGVKKIRVQYEDDHLAVIVKPAGVAVHGTGAYSLVDRYAEFLAPTTCPPEIALPKPVHAHRLDAPVGGLLVVAKTLPALQSLSCAFEERRVHKRYRAVVIGRPPADEGSITGPVDGKEALTRFVLVNCTASAAFGQLSQLDLFPETGRKHQLRIHCAQGLGTPILGDLRYGPDDTMRTRGLFLFACGLALDHPTTGEAIRLEAELPEIYGNTINMERNKKIEVEAAEAAGLRQDKNAGG